MGGAWHHIPVRLISPGPASSLETRADEWLLGWGAGGVVGELEEDGEVGQTKSLDDFFYSQ